MTDLLAESEGLSMCMTGATSRTTVAGNFALLPGIGFDDNFLNHHPLTDPDRLALDESSDDAGIRSLYKHAT